MNDGDLCVDEDRRVEDVEPMARWSGNAVGDCMWHLFFRAEMDDPHEILERKDRMYMELARYGRVGQPGEHLGWEDVSIVRVRQLHQQLGLIVSEEGAGAALE